MPDLQTLEDITQQPIPNETVLNYELWALKKMGWKLNARTPLAFVVTHPFEHHHPFSLTHPLPLPLNPHFLPPPPHSPPPSLGFIHSRGCNCTTRHLLGRCSWLSLHPRRASN